ncbi:helix-turn-helix domain-containing protein [Agromyces sp. CFH 90414]|uniref:Helix-turn-helix domain-containing protein n=1 Tax=Agromyces agglutinans TaxID=2662258 RepID=A0A6I2FCD9_9MICO|nr:winged helix-turn-helix domain-containing protein [Agromyces agglutinans]MRG61784.1 helix-turn-helix domain-containing protein [Agromyces agglutinans]
MDADADLAAPAKLMGDPARAAMLTALLDGRSLPASDLAAIAGVAAPTASSHLAQLVEGGLVVATRSGRHRYFSLAGAEVARAVEALQAIAPRRPVTSYAGSRAAKRLAEARSCYDHLAGRLALDLADALVGEGSIEPLGIGQPGSLTDRPGPLAMRLGLDRVPPTGKRPAVRGCLDWTERRPHLAGAVGAHMLGVLLADGLLVRDRDDRGLTPTPEGAAWFATFAR